MKKFSLKKLFFPLFFIFALLLSSVSGAFAVTWTERTGSGSRSWTAVTSSSDGAKLAAGVLGGYIYTSTDSGATWTERTGSGSRNWRGITSSSDGTKLAATDNGGYIYTSTDSGATWTERTGSGSRSWYGITSSSDGTKLAAGAIGGSIYTSTDSGATWTERTGSGSRNWYRITSSSDGTKLAAGVFGGFIYTSTDSGATWTERTSAGSRNWYGLTSSSDGTKLAAAANFNFIYTSDDSGVTWIAQTDAGSRNWTAVTSSSDGTKLAASVSGGFIYTGAPDVTAPTISSFTSTTGNGAYIPGQTINITANFSEALGAGSTMTVVLNTGVSVVLNNIAGSTLTGTYTVLTGNVSSDLTVSSITSASVNDAALNNQTSYSVPTAPNNIADVSAIVVDGIPPTLSSFTSTTTNGTYGLGEIINITATFNEALGASSTMTVVLDTGVSVVLSTVSSTTLVGTYTVLAGNASSDLTVASITSASVNDAALNNGTSYSVPSSPNNIADVKAIVVSIPAPVVTSSGGGFYRLGGCDDRLALNYDSYVTTNNGSCRYAPLINSVSTTSVLSIATTSQTTTLPITASPKYVFTRDLKLNMKHQEVLELQKYLNAQGFTIATTGLGSPGNEIDRFGRLTYNALVKFQEVHAAEILKPSGLKKGTGYFGPSTRKFINESR